MAVSRFVQTMRTDGWVMPLLQGISFDMPCSMWQSILKNFTYWTFNNGLVMGPQVVPPHSDIFLI